MTKATTCGAAKVKEEVWGSSNLPSVPKEKTKTLLNTVQAETCMGMQMEDILKDFIPMERRWIEGLHLCLNMGNACMV
jgi:hypothetical protein